MTATLEERMPAPQQGGPRRRVGDSDEARMDDLIERLERGAMNASEREVLWGGPSGPGLVHTVAELGKAAEKLAQTLGALADKITDSDDGLEAQVRELKLEVKSLKQDTADRNRLWLTWAVAAATILVPSVLWLIGRSIQIMMQGHV